MFELEQRKKEEEEIKRLEDTVKGPPIDIENYTEEEEKKHEDNVRNLREKKGDHGWKILEQTLGQGAKPVQTQQKNSNDFFYAIPNDFKPAVEKKKEKDQGDDAVGFSQITVMTGSTKKKRGKKVIQQLQ